MRYSFLQRHATRLAALAIVLVLLGFTLPPSLPKAERANLASQFRFTAMPLPQLDADYTRGVRTVHPSLARIDAWISSVGAAVALADLDGDGLANDLCHVDPRIDRVVVAPVPGTGARYSPFALDPDPVAFDPDTMAPMGCLAGDLNENGRMDLLVYYWGRTPIAFLRHGEGSPNAQAYVAQDIYPGGERWYTNAATLADVDGDGHLDLIIGNYFQDGARILDAAAQGVEVMHETKSSSHNGGRNRLLLFEAAGSGERPWVRFREVTEVFPQKVDYAWTLGIGAADLDGDLLPEIYFANDFGPDRLLHNRSSPGEPRFELVEGRGGFTVPASFRLGYGSFKGMGVDFGDVNGDGWLDIYVSNIAAEYALQESHYLWLSTGRVDDFRRGVAPYVQSSEPLGLSRSGWGWDTRLADMNNDGQLEAIQATGFIKGDRNRWADLQSLGTGNDTLMSDPRHWPSFRPGDDVSGQQANVFFVRGAGGRYYDLAAEVGLGAVQVSRGIAVADVDGNGALDIVVANQWEDSLFYRNECPRCGAFLGLNLRLPVSGGGTRPAIGAEATVTLPDGRRLVAQVDGGSGHSGQRAPELHFGLGQLPQEARIPVELRWRDRSGMHHRSLELSSGRHTLVLE